jgi:hypothetical protein
MSVKEGSSSESNRENSFIEMLSLIEQIKNRSITDDKEINDILIRAITFGKRDIEWDGHIEKLENGKRIYIVHAEDIVIERDDNKSLEVIDFYCRYNMSDGVDSFDIEEFFDRDNPVVFSI